MALIVKNLPANAGDERDAGLIPGLGRSPGGRHGNPLQCSCLENPMEKGAWWATVHGVTNSQTDCSDLAHTYALQKVCIFIKILIRRKSFSKVTYMTKLKYI